jgi:hypothetical protein
MIHPTPTKVLLTTTFEPLVRQLSGSLARGVRLIEQFLHDEPTPTTTMIFERELNALLREVGRRIMAWTLNRLEPQADNEAPSRVSFEGRLYRRRRKHPHVVGTLFGPVTLWRRLYEPRGHHGRSIHPLELRLGIEAGLATPALAERVGTWATDHSQHEVLEMVQRDHGVCWSCTSLRKLLGSLRAGMAPYREEAQVERIVSWIEQARALKGHFRPTLSVGRDGIFVPLRGGVAQEGATATVSMLDRRGKRVGTAYLGRHVPAVHQGVGYLQQGPWAPASLARPLRSCHVAWRHNARQVQPRSILRGMLPGEQDAPGATPRTRRGSETPGPPCRRYPQNQWNLHSQGV